VAREREGGVAGRCKPKEKAHSREGAMGQAGLPGRRGRWQPSKRNGPAWRPGPTGPKSKERLKSYLIFEFRWIFWNLTRLGENLQVDLRGIWT
jgi:hypothetical protein